MLFHRPRTRASLFACFFGLLIYFPSLAKAQSAPVDTDPLNRQPEVREAFQHFYSLDYDGAIARFENIQNAHPEDPIATAYLLDAKLFKELYRLDLLDTTFYANDGFLTGKHTVIEDPQMRDQIKSLADKAISQADVELKADPNNLNALFARGWARSLESTYIAMVERSFVPALHLALDARGDHAKVLDKDPNYVDAKMVVGTYQYVIGSLPFAFKLLIGFAGITGSKTKGIAMLHDSAAHGVITSVESRTCLMLFLRRDGQYQEAQQIAQGLKAEYPRDFLFRLEEANLSKDGGAGLKAVALYRNVIDLAQRPGYFYNPHLELAYFGLGDSLRGQNMYADAVNAYRSGANQPATSPELKRRCLLAAGEVYDLIHDHGAAAQSYQEVIASGSDSAQAALAKKYLKTPYSGH